MYLRVKRCKTEAVGCKIKDWLAKNQGFKTKLGDVLWFGRKAVIVKITKT
ncbi:MAG: hypothetical protein KR126chlam3_00952, partial [Chlamydiae bacterium]|nr:hypothetical protein [Chlamydiota bacterium]